MATPDNPMNRRRSKRVMLQIKVTVIAEDVERKARKEEALTLVVNAHGGLLKMKMEVQLRPAHAARKLAKQGGAKLPGRPSGRYFTRIVFRGLRVRSNRTPKFWPVVFLHPRIGMLRGRDAGQGNFSSPELAPSSPLTPATFSKNSGFNIGMERRPLWRTLR